MHALLAATLISLAACESPPPAGPAMRSATIPDLSALKETQLSPALGTAAQDARPNEEIAAAEAAELQRQTQQMIDDLAMLRAEAASGMPRIHTTTSTAPEIQWNDPASRAPVAVETPQHDESALVSAPSDNATVAPIAQPPLANDTATLNAAASRLIMRSDILEEPLLAQDSHSIDQAAALIGDLCNELRRRAAASDRPLRELLVIAATTMLEPGHAIDPALIPGLTERDREVLNVMQDFFARLGRELESQGDAEQVAAAVTALSAAIAKAPQIRLNNAGLCWRVDGFARYERFDKNAFLAHSKQKVIIYVEVGEFQSAQNDAGEFITRLSQKLIVYSERDGIPVWQEDWQPAVDRTKNRRTDFFLTQIMTLPEALSVGKYLLKVRVRDEESKAEAETTIPFEMVADTSLAARFQ